jgi:hypothetical protein
MSGDVDDRDREHLRRFAQRDWAAIAGAKERHWLREKRRLTLPEIWRRADDLLRHARTVKGDTWSTDRRADVDVHQRVGQALRAVNRPAR